MGEKSRAVLGAADKWLVTIETMALLGKTPSLGQELADMKAELVAAITAWHAAGRDAKRLRLIAHCGAMWAQTSRRAISLTADCYDRTRLAFIAPGLAERERGRGDTNQARPAL